MDIWNKYSLKGGKGWSSTWGLGAGRSTLRSKRASMFLYGGTSHICGRIFLGVCCEHSGSLKAGYLFTRWALIVFSKRILLHAVGLSLLYLQMFGQVLGDFNYELLKSREGTYFLPNLEDRHLNPVCQVHT